MMAGETLGPIEGHVTLKRDIPGDPPLFVPVKGNVRGTIRLAPSVLNLGHVVGYAVVTPRIVLSGSGEPFQLVDVKHTGDGWELRHRAPPRPDEKGPLRIELTIRVPNTAGPIKTRLDVEVASQGGKRRTITLPLIGAINTPSTRGPISKEASNP
jgi:hypothetical protein